MPSGISTFDRSRFAGFSIWIVSCLGLAALVATAWAADPTSNSLPADRIRDTPPSHVGPSVVARFARDSNETPDLRRHVVPLLSRLGCNAAACHGSKEGQGGFQLSLFGFDYLSDLKELADEGDPPRANWKSPSDSAILLKPTLQEDHEGGKRFEPDGWEHRLLLQWVKARAPGVESHRTAEFVRRLEVRPERIVFRADGARADQQLQVVAHWSDGTSEDVTPLSRFQSNNDAVIQVSSDGLVSRDRPGDAYIVVFYDQAIASVQAIVAHSSSDVDNPSTDPNAKPIDALVDAKLRELGLDSSAICSDEDFLRRVSLDLTGTLPTAQEVEAFASLKSLQKRAAKIDELLASDQYARWWTTWLCDLTGNNESVMPTPMFRAEQSRQWYGWILKRVRENTPYDQIVAGLIVSPSRSPGQSYADYCEEMTSYVRREDPADFAERATMPYFWARFNIRSPADKTLAFAYSFLGVQVQCAECHKHPFDRWTRKDFDGLKAFFATIQHGRPSDASSEYDRISAQLQVPNGAKRDAFVANLARDGHTIPWTETFLAADRRGARQRNGVDQLSTLMEWMRGLDHPYLAMAFVNRVWHHYFGIGIVDPPDDLSLANPPSNRELLDYLTVGFVSSGYDMKWLHREILNSRAYQRSWETTTKNASDSRNFSHASLRRLPAEVLYDAVWIATAADQSEAVQSGERAIGVASGLGRSDKRFGLLQSLGKPARSAICERERSNLPTLSQSLFLQNSPEMHTMMSRPNGWLGHIAASLTAANEAELNEIIHSAYLRTVSRPPSASEMDTCRIFIEKSPNRAAGLQGVVWALLNSKEFCVNR
jgi:hypothetical protein